MQRAKFVITDKHYLDDIVSEFRIKLAKVLESASSANKVRKEKEGKYMYADMVNVVVEVNEEP